MKQKKADGHMSVCFLLSCTHAKSPYNPIGATIGRPFLLGNGADDHRSPAPRLFLYLYSFTKFSRSAFMTTQKLDRLIAAAPNIGSSIQPVIGIHTPAASGMPITL